jgi:ADP-heptose:LPS heptosyltransferase
MSYLNLDKMLRIGVYWKEAHSSNSCPLQYWSPLFTVQEVSFYNLRTPISSEVSYLLKALGVINLESELSDYTRTAAFIKQLDIVITTDNSIVHLAGALDKQVWVLLGQHSGWRWLLDCENSPWYPSVRLFRKNHTEDWQTLIERVSFALLETIIENS